MNYILSSFLLFAVATTHCESVIAGDLNTHVDSHNE